MAMLADLRKLSPAERLRLLDAVEEHLERRSLKSPVPQWQRTIVRDRYEEVLLETAGKCRR